MNRHFFVLALLTLAACGKKDEVTPAPAASSSAALVASAPSASASASASPTAGASWAGTYTLAAGVLSIPSANPDYKGVKQAKDDPAKFMGDGTLTLAVDANGRITGTVDGPAGPALVTGDLVNGDIRGLVSRKDPKDEGLFGTISAKVTGNAAEGTMSLSSEGNAEIVREAKVTLKKK